MSTPVKLKPLVKGTLAILPLSLILLLLALHFLPGSLLAGEEGKETAETTVTAATTVYATATGRKYHREDCVSLSRSKITISLGDALRSGYAPCGICKPPELDAAQAAYTANAAQASQSGAAALYRVNVAALRSFTAADLSKMTKAEVVSHVDGDTVRVRIANPPEGLEAVETIRMIGADTPETVHPRREVEFFGKEASEFTKARLLGKPVLLAFDWDPRDRYGRLLAYIYTPDGECHNAALIREGYAHAYTRFAFQFMDEFRNLEQQARQAKRGLWAE
ncbi:MAG: thermonuclease family protein [Treponema sp.]|jgi:micrococcal nuclease|nr:thermonuclease family protein [Treponema sp.]